MAAVGYGVVNAGTYTTDKFVCGSDQATDGIVVNTNKFTVAADSGNTLIAGTLAVTGATVLNGGLTMDTNKFTVADTSGNTAIGGTLAVTGNVAVNTNKFTVTAASGNTLVAGTLAVAGDVAVNTNKFTVTATNGNTAVAGTLAITGATTCAAITSSGAVLSTGTGGLGYATGAGGAVVQATSRSTGVTLNKICGSITTHTASLAAGAEATFTVTNTLVAATDVVVVSLQTPSATGLSLPFVSSTAAGSFNITLTNLHASTADTSASVINFVVIKSVAA